MWVCRAGKKGEYLDNFTKSEKVYLVWSGFEVDLSLINDMDSFRDLVCKEKGTNNKTSLSNWAGQLRAFSKDMKAGEYVLVPDACSRHFMLARLKSDYCFTKKSKNGFHHSRDIEVIICDIPKGIFPKNIQYGLRAYRTVYRVRSEEEILRIIDNWRKKESDK